MLPLLQGFQPQLTQFFSLFIVDPHITVSRSHINTSHLNLSLPCSDSLCQCCLLFISPTTNLEIEQKHQPGLEALRESSQNGCPICVQILDLFIHSQHQSGSNIDSATQFSWIVDDNEGIDEYAFFSGLARFASIQIWPIFSGFPKFSFSVMKWLL